MLGQLRKCLHDQNTEIKSTFPKGGAFEALLAASNDPTSKTLPVRPMGVVGFNTAHTVIQLDKAAKLRVCGIEVSSLCTLPVREAQQLPNVVKNLLACQVDSWNFLRLWCGNEKAAEKDTPLQAWLAPWCVYPNPIE